MNVSGEKKRTVIVAGFAHTSLSEGCNQDLWWRMGGRGPVNTSCAAHDTTWWFQC